LEVKPEFFSELTADGIGRGLVGFGHAARQIPVRLVLGIDEQNAAEHVTDGHDFDNLPLAEQIRVIHECWTIVAVHGSALGHLLHAPLAGHIVKIANAHIARPDIWGLAALAGWSHAIAPAAPVPWEGDGEDPINHDLTADVAALREALLGARL
jgi:hypothetical protein